MFVLNISIKEHIRQHTEGVTDVSYYAIGPKVLETLTWTVALLLTEDTHTCSVFKFLVKCSKAKGKGLPAIRRGKHRGEIEVLLLNLGTNKGRAALPLGKTPGTH